MVVYLTVASSCADVAQSVAHLIGSEEVTGPIPVISCIKKLRICDNPVITQFFLIYVYA